MKWLTGILGLAMAFAPFIFQYSSHAVAMWTSIGLGAVVIVLSLLEVLDESPRHWEYWVAGLVGVAAVAAPFAFGFTALTWALWLMIGFGLLMILISGYEVYTEQTSVH